MQMRMQFESKMQNNILNSVFFAHGDFSQLWFPPCNLMAFETSCTVPSMSGSFMFCVDKVSGELDLELDTAANTKVRKWTSATRSVKRLSEMAFCTFIGALVEAPQTARGIRVRFQSALNHNTIKSRQRLSGVLKCGPLDRENRCCD